MTITEDALRRCSAGTGRATCANWRTRRSVWPALYPQQETLIRDAPPLARDPRRLIRAPSRRPTSAPCARSDQAGELLERYLIRKAIAAATDARRRPPGAWDCRGRGCTRRSQRYGMLDLIATGDRAEADAGQGRRTAVLDRVGGAGYVAAHADPVLIPRAAPLRSAALPAPPAWPCGRWPAHGDGGLPPHAWTAGAGAPPAWRMLMAARC